MIINPIGIRNLTQYFPPSPFRCCIKPKRSDILSSIYTQMNDQHSVVEQRVSDQINTLLNPGNIPYKSAINPIHLELSDLMVSFIQAVRSFVTDYTDLNTQHVNICLGLNELVHLKQTLTVYFKNDLACQRKPYYDGFRALSNNNAWLLCFLEGDALETAIKSHFNGFLKNSKS